jgi:serine/threonine protein kinase
MDSIVSSKTCILTFQSSFRARKRDIRERTLQEVSLLNRLSHPHILRLIAAYESPTELVINGITPKNVVGSRIGFGTKRI